MIHLHILAELPLGHKQIIEFQPISLLSPATAFGSLMAMAISSSRLIADMLTSGLQQVRDGHLIAARIELRRYRIWWVAIWLKARAVAKILISASMGAPVCVASANQPSPDFLIAVPPDFGQA
jgi:hypothetical protein